MKRLKTAYPFGVFSALILLLACQPTTGNLDYYPELKNRFIQFSSNDLTPINTEKDPDYFRGNQSPIVLIVLKGKCENCHLELNQWQAIITENQWEDQANFMVIIEEEISYLLEHEIKSGAKFSVPIYHDVDGSFIANNFLKPLVYERAAILNSNRTVRFVGSPLLKPHLKDQFLKSAGLKQSYF
ncbi:MAG: hypothetical protein R8G66_18385 [Cytophagales bacterium]|nr:hypothetical protein [Cytophagales bacterium]